MVAQNIIPTHYDLEFEPDLEKFTFRGRATIQVHCDRPTTKIMLDCSELDVTSVQVIPGAHRPSSGEDSLAHGLEDSGRGSAALAGAIVPSSVTTDDKAELLTIRLPKRIPRGNAEIIMEFAGALNDRLLGFYYSRYKDGDRTGYLATTQFEAADARRAFPCWDRPNAKATFSISIIVSDGRYEAVSNMPVASRCTVGQKTIYKFDKTPPMSTYLVYLGMGEFEISTGRTERGTEIRVITTRTAANRGGQNAEYAMECARKLLVMYEDYFGIEYPLPKLDLIAVPDFAAGAMENWGAITFRENLLLYDPASSSTRTMQLITEVISHELAHQWFGNRVTMRWWNDLWLNESFATFLATKLVDQLYPQWDLWGQFLMDAMNPAMHLDSLRSTHPIDVRVRSPAQIREIFDSISYDKGGCVLRMLEQYVGEDAFRSGLNRYLTKFAYDNAEGTDLWMCIEAVSGKPVTAMMQSWLKKSGFPVVSVTANRGAGVTVCQERYMQRRASRRRRSSNATAAVADDDNDDDGTEVGEEGDNTWPIPLSTRPYNDRTDISKRMFDSRSLSLLLPSGSEGVIANPDRTGFYRVMYDDSILSEMGSLVESGGLSDTEAWALQNDLFAMCVSGRAPVGLYLKMLDSYGTVTDYATIADIGGNLSYLYRLSLWCGSAAAVAETGRHALEFYRRVHNITGWTAQKGERHTMALLRGPAVEALGRLGHAETIERSMRLYRDLSESPRAVTPDLVDPVCTVVAWNSADNGISPTDVHAGLVDMYMRADTTEQKMRFLGAMCGFRDVNLLTETLDFTRSEHVRSQNLFQPILRVSENPYGRGVLWPWLQENWSSITGKVGVGNPLLGRVISGLSHVCERQDIPGIRSFFARNPVPGTERTILQTVERIRIRADVRARMAREFGPARDAAGKTGNGLGANAAS